MMTRMIAILAVTCASALLAAADDPQVKSEKREMLALHETVAKLKGIAYQQCRGLTAQCPDKCGHSGDFATFEIVTYLKYEKPGQYGDPQAPSFTFQLEDNMKNLKVPKELAEKVWALKAGDYVLLNWKHEYVTVEENGTKASFPERVVTELKPITKLEADKLAKQIPATTAKPGT